MGDDLGKTVVTQRIPTTNRTRLSEVYSRIKTIPISTEIALKAPTVQEAKHTSTQKPADRDSSLIQVDGKPSLDFGLQVPRKGPRSVFRVLLSRKTRANVPHDLWEQLPPGVLEDVLKTTSEQVLLLNRYHQRIGSVMCSPFCMPLCLCIVPASLLLYFKVRAYLRRKVEAKCATATRRCKRRVEFQLFEEKPESNGFDRNKAKTKYWIEISYWPLEKHKQKWDVPETGSSGVLIYGCEPQMPEDTWGDVDVPGFEDVDMDVDEIDGEDNGEPGEFSDFENDESILRDTPENVVKAHGS